MLKFILKRKFLLTQTQTLSHALHTVLSVLLLITPIAANAAPQKFSNPKSLTMLDRTVATVNDETITESELNRQAQFLMVRMRQSESTMPSPQEFRKHVLEKMIIDKIQLQLAKVAKIEIDDETLEKTLEDIAARDNLSMEQLQQFLEEQGIPFAHFKDSIKTELTLFRLQQQEVGQRIVLSKNEVENFINSPASHERTGAEYRIGHILISVPEDATSEERETFEKEAQALVKELKSGKDFTNVAMEKSAGQQAAKGGDLGWRKLEEIPTLFSAVASKLQKGEVAGPIKNDSGFHIIKLLEKRVGGEPIGKPQVETRLRHIVIRPEARTDQDVEALLFKLRAQALEGTSFGKLAEKYSEDDTKKKEGDLGWVTPNIMPQYRKQLSELKSGEISQPFKADDGWHIVQVLERRSKQASSETVKQKAMDALYQRKFEEKMTRWVKQLREEANVKIYLNEG